MKRLHTLLAVLLATFCHAQNTSLQTSSQLMNATVYMGHGAALNHTARMTLPQGIQEVTINNIATDIDVNTVQIGCPENVVLLSYRFNVKPEDATPVKSLALQKMQDTLKLLQKQQTLLYNDFATTEDILNRTTKLIESNLTNNPKKEISSGELIKLVEYYTQKTAVLKKELNQLQQSRNELDEKVTLLNNRINDYNSNHYTAARPLGQIILQVMSTAPANATFSIAYYTNRAGWMPTYNLRVKSLDNSCRLDYKGMVTQTTGIDWKGVRLTLSTNNPVQSGTIPELNPWLLNLYMPVVEATSVKKQMLAMKAPAPMVLNDADANKDEEEKEVSSSVEAYTQVTENQLNINFEINLPYDIPSDGKGYSVSIKQADVKADYKHYAVPRLDRDAFLLADISEWEKLDLLPGEANIIMDDVYLGKSYINPNETADTLSLSLGRDKRISVKRTLVKSESKIKMKGDLKTEKFVWEIVVKNNKKQAVDLVLKDQYPLSNVKEVEVTLDSDGRGKANSDTGIIEWTLNLKPGESKTIRFGYSVKYPKTMVLQNLR